MFQATMSFYQSLDFPAIFDRNEIMPQFLISINLKPHVNFMKNRSKRCENGLF